MKTLSGKKFIKILEQKGWNLKRINGSHHIYTHPGKTEIISVPVHKNEDLKIGLQKKLMSIAEISDEEL
ncbi:type II toxin-antitoxin system HicA family toxin [Mucilaginibacter gotjawali]|uniref:RNA binding protein YcfA (HicA-like mRNA interferase family) n=1 Tax=Mucilaginibacter gotjawali TaxID=1550579 RepID=A0A839S900_9SPHI|nr:type II toxin-antitoxin system HicA family toxin [Mucilaginibacter gotjawali]MBB3054611.1 putative RNA binding protein YcfA (HicA-like mRNA interferase family) [Mucilaginibacter gotjawali]